MIGDGYCDDETNNFDCNFDGGDCCTVCVNTDYCLDCVCHQSDTADVQTGEYDLVEFSNGIKWGDPSLQNLPCFFILSTLSSKF